ncbi:MAG TPA: hypothetical protein PKA41_16005 [Verrucomicrobiota bacterium]|nr:hypothetical protein [Verrucomicrobiota bacterium]
MESFKFACPVCGQHIRCEPDKAGSHMECPTCFQMLVVPHRAENGSSKYVLTAAKVQTRSVPGTAPVESPAPAKKPFPLGAVLLVIVIAAALGAGYAFRDRIFKPTKPAETGSITSGTAPSAPAAGAANSQSQTPPTPASPASSPMWTLDLAGVKIPQAAATGRIHGKDFIYSRSTVRGGELTLRQGLSWPPDLGMTIYLNAANAEDLAGKTVNVISTAPNPPRIKLRWKDENQQEQTKNVNSGYALRIEFGSVADGHLAGKLYVSTPDPAQSWIAGSFKAEIRKPQAN